MPRRQKSKPVSLACVEALKNVASTTLNRENDPTPERLFHAGVSVALDLGTRSVQIIRSAKSKPDGIVGFDGIIRLKQAPLDRLHARGALDDDPERNRQLFEAGEKLRNHHYLAGLSGFAANDPLSSSGGGHPASRTPITETMERNRRALRLAQASTTAADWRIVSAVVCEEVGLEVAGRAIGYGERHAAHAVALDRLRRGLGDLAEVWGFSPPPRPVREAPPAANDAVAAAAA